MDDPFENFRISPARLCLCAVLVAVLLALALIWRPDQTSKKLFAPRAQAPASDTARLENLPAR